MYASEDMGTDDLPEDVSADGERVVLRSPLMIIHGPPKEDSLVRVEERNRA